MTERELTEYGSKYLKDAGIADGESDAQYLLSELLEEDYNAYILNRNREVPEDMRGRFFDMLEKRAAHVPAQHLISYVSFYRKEYRYKVNEDVLIPRPETEELVRFVLETLENLEDRRNTKVKILDLCCGSGCIGITIAKECKSNGIPAEVELTDISPEAVAVARDNAMDCDGVSVICGDLFSGVREKKDIIVSNPPYIADADIEKLEPEVRDHEPRLALSGHEDGLHFYRRIVAECGAYLCANGLIFFEIGYDQADAVSAILANAGFTDIMVRKDLNGKDRMVFARKQD